MSFFFSDPEANVFSSARVGGVKAVASGLVILGTGENEVLSYVESPPEIAVVWRNALNDLLKRGSYRGFRGRDIDWWAMAAEVDPSWAAKQGYTPSSTGTSASLASQPVRRRPTEADPDDL